ncbi:hypothetical protein TOT_040000775 [Theileria orientalis strain Shintoku]|uniref:Uncharacterized protein n=1 Tax=Theileria orientalis strain Shintoku TaxID=869250 RepID=J7M8L7_THEOR|nr:hypothetical protein TOT_040000775 [Theileria orientalis strain Shintoku]BAM42408.1 hypothetical protein TOT_040000775 [Theileria orientalis strain Shintoku]|eukprot:XP_009692709.1 hypothetical protein TOT_040000775 [Theileria orientalis strain Shintoku]
MINYEQRYMDNNLDICRLAELPYTKETTRNLLKRLITVKTIQIVFLFSLVNKMSDDEVERKRPRVSDDEDEDEVDDPEDVDDVEDDASESDSGSSEQPKRKSARTWKKAIVRTRIYSRSIATPIIDSCLMLSRKNNVQEDE